MIVFAVADVTTDTISRGINILFLFLCVLVCLMFRKIKLVEDPPPVCTPANRKSNASLAFGMKTTV